MKPASAPRYSGVAISLHWLMAVLIISLFCLGFYMHGLKFSPWKLRVISWHKWAGVSAFALVAVRAGWRLSHPAPALPAGMNGAVRFAAHAGHALLYALMVAVPLSGWLMSSAKGFQTVYFGIWPIPDALPKDPGLADLLAQVHYLLNLAFIAVVAGHFAAALKHHLIDRDEVLTRMLPRAVTISQESRP